MSIKHALLGIIAEAPGHGYDLKSRFDERVGEFWPLNFGQIYTTLERLYQDGWVEYESVTQGDKPDKKIYRITAEGRSVFETWRTSSIKPEPRVLRDELFLRLMFARPDDIDLVLNAIQTQQSVYMAHMMQLTARKFQIEETAQHALEQAADEAERSRIQQDRVIQSLLLDVAIYHAEADIRWLRHCEIKLKDIAAS